MKFIQLCDRHFGCDLTRPRRAEDTRTNTHIHTDMISFIITIIFVYELQMPGMTFICTRGALNMLYVSYSYCLPKLNLMFNYSVHVGEGKSRTSHPSIALCERIPHSRGVFCTLTGVSMRMYICTTIIVVCACKSHDWTSA